MSFANASVTDIIATTIEKRSPEIFDNVTKNNAAYVRLSQKGKIKPISGGSQIDEIISFATNANAQWYQGYDPLAIQAQDVISAAVFQLRQLACAVPISGLEELQNAGPEQKIDLLDGRMEVAEASMNNLMAQGFYSDGTGFGGKQLVGLGAAVIDTPSSGVYGGIDPSVWTFWQNAVQNVGSTPTTTTIQPAMNTLYLSLVRGKDKPDLILFDTSLFSTYLGSLQTIQRFSDPKLADLGFTTVKFMGADVVLDGGVGGFEASAVGHFLNTNYLFLRPHRERNMVPLKERVAFNQDAKAAVLAWAGAITCANRSLQGYFRGS